MTLNRHTLRQYKSVMVYDKMIPNKRGHLSASPCFKSYEWIEAHKEFIFSLRKDWVLHNQKLLDLVTKIGDIK